MPSSHADYIQIPQHPDDVQDDEEDDVGESPSADHLHRASSSRSPTAAGGSRSASTSGSATRRGRPGKIDLRSLDNAFKRWTVEITQKVKRKKKSLASEAKKEIVFSVFQRVTPTDAFAVPTRKTLDDGPPRTDREFEEIANSVRMAILDGVHPKMITKGSSGSYFARRKQDSRTQVVGVFKPKDEEPYGHLNPKTTKWIHRNFFWWVGFGRACLIPNLSYISEAAASLLDERLDLRIVPQTKLVSLSSPAFSYGWLDRANYKKGKPLPEKVGSMQTFLHGYQDATAFLRDHPWPGRAIADTYDDTSHRSGSAAVKRCSAALGVMCGRIGEVDDEDDFDELYDRQLEYPPPGSFSWTPALQQEFREELEKLIILDYLMRNTDRGLDNFMIKYCEGNRAAVVNRAPLASPMPQLPTMSQPTPTVDPSPFPASQQTSQMIPGRSPSPSAKLEVEASSPNDKPHIHLAAIDNSLSFPHQHPKGWREFTYGWLFLPVSLIGRPFSKATRDHFLPLLSDPEWWSETTFQLRKLHKTDDGFNERMFQRQMAVMKGQGWNIVQSLNHLDEGPLELTRRTKVMVWDEEIEVPVDASPEEIIAIVSAAQTKPGTVPGDIVAQPTRLRTPLSTTSSIPEPASVPSSPPVRSSTRSPPRRLSLDRRSRSYSIGSRLASLGKGVPKSEFPPFQFPGGRSHSRRGSAADPSMRPVPLSSKKLGGGAMLGGATGVSVLAHLEKLDAVESGLNRVIGDGLSPRTTTNGAVLFEEEEEEDVGEAVAGPSIVVEPAVSEEPIADETDGDIVTAANAAALEAKAKPETALALDLGSPPRPMKRSGTVQSAIAASGAGPSLEQLLGSDDLESGLQTDVVGNGVDRVNASQHTRWANSVDERPRRTPNGTASFDFSRDPLRKTRIVVAERLETVDATPIFAGW